MSDNHNMFGKRPSGYSLYELGSDIKELLAMMGFKVPWLNSKIKAYRKKHDLGVWRIIDKTGKVTSEFRIGDDD